LKPLIAETCLPSRPQCGSISKEKRGITC
jgi:hypothetical protein